MADLSLTATSVVKYDGASVRNGVAGEAITAGQALYVNTAGRLMRADCATAAKANIVGVALNGGAVNQPIQYIVAGGLNPGATVTVGTIYGVTDTPGGIGPISDRGSSDFVTIIGVAVTSTRINVDIARSGVAIP